MRTATLTPTTNTAPAIVSVSSVLSGPQWAGRFQGSKDTDSLDPAFRRSVEAFINALRAAGVHVSPDSTYRPPARSYLMHWSWMIKHGTDPATVPPMDGINIEWVHPTYAASTKAAEQMVSAFGMNHLHTPPALHSLHNERKAIDMNISWEGSVAVQDSAGKQVDITTKPRTGMNPQIVQVGASYGVIKFVGGTLDKPHWSTTGR